MNPKGKKNLCPVLGKLFAQKLWRGNGVKAAIPTSNPQGSPKSKYPSMRNFWLLTKHVSRRLLRGLSPPRKIPGYVRVYYQSPAFWLFPSIPQLGTYLKNCIPTAAQYFNLLHPVFGRHLRSVSAILKVNSNFLLDITVRSLYRFLLHVLSGGMVVVKLNF